MQDIYSVVLAIVLVVLSVWLVFKVIGWLAVFLRARVVKNKRIPLPQKCQKLLGEKGVIVLYFSSPLAERGRNRMGGVMKLVDEEYGNVIKFNLTSDRKEAEKFNVITAPTIVVIDGEGIVREYKSGFISYPRVKAIIERYLKRSKQ
ncbi:MAG: hypothetical protein ABDH28_03530 [Brevinematia bacterium]